jgi:hypothetical protein
MKSKQKDIYLVAFYHMRPRNGVNTSKKGWMNDTNNVTYDESLEITRGLKNNSSMAKVILNLSTKTVYRNTWGTDRNFRDYFKHYFTSFHKYLTTVMVQLDPEYMNELLDEMQADLDAKQVEEPAETVTE